jgi:UPF0271 protein
MEWIDLNCDMGEGMPDDEALMPLISSANIACGYHAGNAALMARTVESALRHGVAIGAHPGFDDRDNFGRTELHLPAADVYALVRMQIRLLREVCARQGAVLRHVKPHGALYNMAARDAVLAEVLARATVDEDPGLVLYGLSGSFLLSEAEKLGLRTASEVFADRTYQDDGSLTPRKTPGALIDSDDRALAQVLHMVKRGTVVSVSGALAPIKAETLCLHGDGAHAVSFATTIRHMLDHEGIQIKIP